MIICIRAELSFEIHIFALLSLPFVRQILTPVLSRMSSLTKSKTNQDNSTPVESTLRQSVVY